MLLLKESVKEMLDVVGSTKGNGISRCLMVGFGMRAAVVDAGTKWGSLT